MGEVTYLSLPTAALSWSPGDDDGDDITDSSGDGLDGSLPKILVQIEAPPLESFAGGVMLRLRSCILWRSFSIMVLTTASELSRPSRQSDAYILAQRTFAAIKSKPIIHSRK